MEVKAIVKYSYYVEVTMPKAEFDKLEESTKKRTIIDKANEIFIEEFKSDTIRDLVEIMEPISYNDIKIVKERFE